MQNQSTKTYAQEATLTKKVKDYLNAQSDTFYFKSSERFIKGVSDILACCNGIFVAIELKAEKGTPSPHQLLFIKSVQATGGIGGVCYSVADVENLLKIARNK